MNLSNYKCKICGGYLFKTVKSNFYQYYSCTNCFTSQLNPLPTQIELDTLYDKYHLSDEKGGSYDWVEDRMKADFPAKIKLVKHYTSKTKIKLLDVGCGKGFFVQACLKHNIDAIGIDISASGINYAKNILNIKAEQTDITNFSKRLENQNCFDVITLWATIEHLPNPIEVLNSIHSCLKPGGLLFLDTGLGNERFEKFLPGHSQWYDAPQHLFVYSVEGLKSLLNNAGFNIIKIDKNFERNFLRRIIKYIRHFILCFGSYLLLSPLIGRSGFAAMKKESKWPIGKLIQIIAKKI